MSENKSRADELKRWRVYEMFHHGRSNNEVVLADDATRIIQELEGQLANEELLNDGYIKQLKDERKKLLSANTDNLDRIAELEAEQKLDRSIILTEYTEYLEKQGYVDCDWWAEQPGSVDDFLEGKSE